MHKAIDLPRTYLTHAFLYGHKALRLPLDIHEYIAEQLGPEDWTYLALFNGYNVEIVKVVSATGEALDVLRAQDFTEEASFQPGSIVYSTLTAAQLMDRENITPLNLELQGVVVEEEGKITIPSVVFSGFDYIYGNHVGRRVEPTPFIALKVEYGCCDA